MPSSDGPAPVAVLIAGSPGAQSSSRRVAELLLQSPPLAHFEDVTIELASLPADGLLARGDAAEITAALAEVERADLVVIATPIYRATYTGLLKSFFDLMPTDFLVGKVCVGVATGAGAGHRLAIDHGIRPLVASLGGLTAAAGIYATSDALEDGTPSEDLAREIAGAAAEVAALATRGQRTTGA
jgi:FMN reductase